MNYDTGELNLNTPDGSMTLRYESGTIEITQSARSRTTTERGFEQKTSRTKGCNGAGEPGGLAMVALSRPPAEPCRSSHE